MDYHIISEVPESLHEPLLEMIHKAFYEHQERGLRFTCSNYTLDDLKSKVLNGKCFVALDHNETPIGITSIKLNADGSAYENITATSPESKGMGVATALYNARTIYLKDAGCKYLLSDTAEKAYSSVKWHLKKCHCRIVGYISYSSTNYYSFIFKEDFIPVSLIERFKDKFHFIRSYIYYHIFYNQDGKYSFWGRFRYGQN